MYAAPISTVNMERTIVIGAWERSAGALAKVTNILGKERENAPHIAKKEMKTVTLRLFLSKILLRRKELTNEGILFTKKKKTIQSAIEERSLRKGYPIVPIPKINENNSEQVSANFNPLIMDMTSNSLDYLTVDGHVNL